MDQSLASAKKIEIKRPILRDRRTNNIVSSIPVITIKKLLIIS